MRFQKKMQTYSANVRVGYLFPALHFFNKFLEANCKLTGCEKLKEVPIF